MTIFIVYYVFVHKKTDNIIRMK